MSEHEGMMTRQECLEVLLDQWEEIQEIDGKSFGAFNDLKPLAEQLAATRFFTYARVLGFDLPQNRDAIAAAAREELALNEEG